MAVDAAAFPGAAAAEAAKAGSAHVDMAKLQRSGGVGVHVGHPHHQPRHLTKAEESKAMTVFMTLFMLMMLAQCLLVYWKKKRYKSYQQVTLFGLWLIPFLCSTSLHFYRLLAAWFLWTSCCSYVIFRATRKPLPDRTPRLVYTFFLYAFKITYTSGAVGYPPQSPNP